MMKKIIIVLCSMFFVVGCQKENININVGKVNYDYKFDFIEKDICNNEISEYYKVENQKVYFVCLSEMYIQENNDKITLKNYLNNKKLETEIQSIADMMEVDDIFKDRGTTIYRDENKILSTKGFTMIKCNTLGGNKDVYFGPRDLDYQDEYCKSS